MFQNQQNANRGGAPPGANRLQNGKLGEDVPGNGSGALADGDIVGGGAGTSQWAFGGAMGAPGLSNTQAARTNGGGMSSFAQAMSGSQPHTPLNLE
jgi:CCR4-NOT transcription complex subunit 2